MKHKILWFGSLILILVFLCLLIYIFFPFTNKANKAVHYAGYARDYFYPHLTTPPAVEPVSEKVYGVIVSHHFYAEKEIATLFLKLSNQNPATVVILGPNHYNIGKHNILVSAEPYLTPWGQLQPNLGLIQNLVANKLVFIEEDPFIREHAVSNLVGFIKYVFPQTKIVPIIIKPQTKPYEIDKLVRVLNENLNNESLVVASVDFSHHTTVFKAELSDAISIKQIKSFNCDGLTNDMMDSPLSICILLKYLNNHDANVMTYWQSSSAQISGNYQSQDVTSYLFSYFTKTISY